MTTQSQRISRLNQVNFAVMELVDELFLLKQELCWSSLLNQGALQQPMISQCVKKLVKIMQFILRYVFGFNEYYFPPKFLWSRARAKIEFLFQSVPIIRIGTFHKVFNSLWISTEKRSSAKEFSSSLEIFEITPWWRTLEDSCAVLETRILTELLNQLLN